jgi:hypothetical protein
MIEVIAYLFFTALVITWLLCILQCSVHKKRDNPIEEQIALLKQAHEDPEAVESVSDK